MTYKIEITGKSQTNGELWAAVIAIIKLSDCPESAKAQAIREVVPLMVPSSFETHARGGRRPHARHQAAP
jgi:hypothetical protein